MNFISHSSEDREHILKTIGADSIETLIRRVLPEEFILNRSLDIPSGISESELVREISALSGLNNPAANAVCFMGGGSYDHYIPAAISAILSRPEFVTAYTPYQAEVSQGTLQTIYEFQTMICRLTDMDAANASLYDGATALAEGMLLALRRTRKDKIVIPYGLNPHYKTVLETYAEPQNIEVVQLGHKNGVIDAEELRTAVNGAGAVVIQQPNFFGLIEPAEQAAAIAKEAGAITIASFYPTSLALLKPPGKWGADIATAEGQSLGVPMSLGGPYLGLFAVKQQLIRFIPGRLVARAVDREGRDGFVLTLQTREQHIRREKATSNICTNQALVALNALVYLSLVGPDGLKRAALNSYRGAHYLSKKISEIPGCKLIFDGEFFNEFAVALPTSGEMLQKALIDKGYFVGPVLDEHFPDYEGAILITVTEKRTKEEMDNLIKVIHECL